MTQQPPQDPYGQQQPPPQADPYASHQGYSQPMYPGYPQYQQYQQRPPRQPLDIGQLLFIGAWVVLGLYGVRFLYYLTLDETSPGGFEDFADRLFSQFTMLGEGLFFVGVLLFLSTWLRRSQQQGS